MSGFLLSQEWHLGMLHSHSCESRNPEPEQQNNQKQAIIYTPASKRNGKCLTKREKGTTINGTLRLAAKHHESAEPLNLTWTEYQVFEIAFFILAIAPYFNQMQKHRSEPICLPRLRIWRYFPEYRPLAQDMH